MTPASIALAARMKAQRQAELAAIPPGHTVALAVTRIFGPKGKIDPRGHPIHLDTGLFDNSVESAVQAIARVANKREGVGVNLDHWKLEMYEDVIQPPPHKQPVPFTRFYSFVYLPEQPLWQQKGLHDGNVPNHFKDSWYLTRNHLTTTPDQSLATALAPITEGGR
jgi:hypothetical protein